MTEKDFLSKAEGVDIKSGSVKWQAPSNIALVKYWGKKESQIPANPSISFTLNNCQTITQLIFKRTKRISKEIDFEFYLDEELKEGFKPKIQEFFKRIDKYCPYLKQFQFEIHSENTFPHSSGIASSASGMSALAMCVIDLEKQLFPDMTKEYFFKKASFLSRLGSGSACRSVTGKIVVWGDHPEIPSSSNLYGIEYPFEIHKNFKNFRDTILLVDKGEKQVSSSIGHNLMHDHPFAAARFNQAETNLTKLIPILKNGDLPGFFKIVESEALSLHAMMMCSQPYFILMKPNTLEIITKIWDFRNKTNIPICFTLDAGANVHILYPENVEAKVSEFIKNELVAYCQNGQYICDHIGDGAKKL